MVTVTHNYKKQRLTLASSYQLGILRILLNVSLKDASKIPLCKIMPTVYVHCSEAKNKHPLQFQIAPTNRRNIRMNFDVKDLFILCVHFFSLSIISTSACVANINWIE